jgi:uncharacterized membrane protein
MAKTSTGLEENIAGLLCYVLGWVSGLIFVLIETENRTVRFHAFQSIIIFGILNVAGIILRWIPAVGIGLMGVISGIAFVFWIVLMYKAYQGEMYKVPWAGNQAEKLTG